MVSVTNGDASSWVGRKWMCHFLSLTSLVAKTDAFMSHRVKEDSSYGSDKGLRSPTMNIKRTGYAKRDLRGWHVYQILCL